MEFATLNGFHDETSSEVSSQRMDRYRVSDEEWQIIQSRLDRNERTAPERSNSNLSQYRVSKDQWSRVEERLKDPGLPPKQPKTSSKSVSRQTSVDSGYAKLDHMQKHSEKGTRSNEKSSPPTNTLDSGKPQISAPDYEKQKKSPHPNRKESSLQQKIQQRKELSQSLQSLSTEGQDPDPLTIPKDGDLHKFTVDEMSTFFRYMRVEEYIVQKLNRKKLDGAKFSKLKDDDLENIGIKNPIIIHFRDKSSCKKRIPFML